MDYLAVHGDRSEFNILFEIEQNKKEFRVCPVYDNEYAFGVLDLSTIIDGYAFEEFRNLKTKDIYDLDIDELSRYKNGDFRTIVPMVYLPVQFDPISEEGVGRITKCYPHKKIRNEYVDYLLKDKAMKEFFLGIKFNAEKCAEQIKNGTGFVIPKIVLQIAQELFNDRYMQIESELYVKMFSGELDLR